MEQIINQKPNNKKTLSTFEASSIICGYGVGGGIMAMPILADKVGIILTIVILLAAMFVSYLLHLMIADLIFKCGKDAQILDIFSKFILKGKTKKVITIILFVLVAIVLYSNLAVYISGAAEIINEEFTFIPVWAGKLIFYFFASLIGMFGLKILGITEKYTIFAIFGVVIALAIGSCFHLDNQLNIAISGFKDAIAFFGLSMFAFTAFFSVPQVVEGLNQNIKQTKKCIAYGMLLNLLIMLIVIFFSLLSSNPITDKAIVGWASGVGTWARILGCFFVILAMLSTYWSISFALRDIIGDALKINKKLALLIATIPSLLITFIPIAGFTNFLNITGGAIAILIGIFVIPAFHMARKENNNQTILGKFACLPVEIIIFISYILMAVGNLI